MNFNTRQTAMAAPATLPALLDTLTKSLSSTLEAAPKLSNIEYPKDGVSLLDVKNELLLSYLQNLVFLIIVKLRQAKNGVPDEQNLDELVVKKLVELRLYLEKGTRPLENHLRYQIDKMLRAADHAERTAKAAEERAQAQDSDSDSASDSDSGSEDNEEAGGSKLDRQLISGPRKPGQFRPNTSAFVAENEKRGTGLDRNSSGVYRPPRVAPQVMPTTERREKTDRKPMKSATLDEFIADELSTAPVAEPSIGMTIVNFGRKVKTASERRVEDERRNFEESNFVRLPKENKKDRQKRAKAEGRTGRMNFGGEEWRELGEGVDRIHRLTQGKKGMGTKALLEKSRKRARDTTDGPRGGGVEMGERFEKRLKVVESGRGVRKR